MKVKLTIHRKRGSKIVGEPITREFQIDATTEKEAKEEAELQFLNEYINRGCKIMVFEQLNLARKAVNLSIKSEVMKESRINK